MDSSAPSSDDCRRAARKLGDLLAQLPLDKDDQWQEIEITAQNLANGLRVKGGPVDSHTALGKTLLPSTLTSLLKSAANEAQVLDATRTAAVYEILRVSANLCMDHDENRGFLLEAGFPQTVVSILEGYAESISSSRYRSDSLSLSIPDLKVIKTAIGVLLNSSIGYEPVKSRLISLEAAVTILRLSTIIYPPGSWMNPHPTAESSEEDVIESWNLRTALSSWAWRAISELKEDNRQAIGPDALPLIATPLLAFIPPYTPPTGLFSQSETSSVRRTLVQADFDTLEEVCSLIEALALDVEDVRLSLARSINSPSEHSGVDCLSIILDFVEHGEPPAIWSSTYSEEEQASKARSFDMYKAAVIKAIVEVAGEEKNEDVLWQRGTDEDGFIARMISWIRSHKNLTGPNVRDDLIICATLSLGNIVRQEKHALAIITPPNSLVPDLITMLEPDTDIKIKHGIIGLLKHLAHTPSAKAPLGEAGVLQKLAHSEVWGERSDIVEIIQVSAIGIAKHLCNSNVENCFVLVIPSEDQATSSTGINQILSLVRRSDSIAVKSEGTRVLVNVIKSLCSSDTIPNPHADKRREAMQAIMAPECAAALAQLVGRSRKYAILINEGVVGLTLMSMHLGGGKIVLDAILNPLPHDGPRTSAATKSIQSSSVPDSASTGSAASSPAVVGPSRALDMIVSILRNSDSQSPFPVEVRANVCALLSQLGKKGVVDDDDGRAADIEKVKSATRGLLETAVNSPGQDAALVSVAAKKTLEVWSA